MTARRLQLSDPMHRRHDVFVEVDDAAPVEHLEAEIEALGFGAKPLTAHGRPFAHARNVADLRLEHGTVIGAGHSVASTRPIESAPHIVVIAGPDAGQVIALPPRGHVVIGRGALCDLPIDDPLLSTRHARIHWNGDERIVLDDLDSTNGTFLENERIDLPTDLRPGEHVQIGTTVFGIAFPLDDDFAVLGGVVDGTRIFPRQFRSALSALPGKIDAPRPVEDDEDAIRTAWWRALLPIFTGIGFAAITGRWIFLLVMVVSPIVGGVEAYRKKKKTARREARLLKEYGAELELFHGAVRTARKAERRRNRDAAHCGGMASMLSLARHRRLWERRTTDGDFTSVAVGLAELPSQIIAKDPAGELDDRQWGTPLQHHLFADGALSLVGPLGRCRAVARNLVINLAATHSPADLHIWILSEDETGVDWGFTKWIPHTFSGDHGSTIAVTDLDRAGALRSLHSLIERRSEADSDGQPSPVHLVVIDGAHLVAPRELVELIEQGQHHGILGITIDEQLVPEGVGATLRLGHVADEATFESRVQPMTDAVIITELTEPTADAAARRMAALKPATSDDAVGLDGTVHLVDLDPVARLSGAELAARWRNGSPHSDVIIGATSDGVMHVDLVKDGPHGLIGGTSGSGKTEFLKTMFVSLCLHNHPDDLSIVVVDFKGGVDHEAIRPLPHVIDVATNLDIEQFQRTILMLRAEQNRRQDMLASVGASNITAYRAARAADASLPPMPRLLVVVDEFGELLSTPEGKEQVKELESVTRIGRALGLHLLLVTQNFENNLPAQIDANAGLRICLRVQKPGHSKIVLDSDAAALIPDNRIGRGFSRFHGRDLIEFQTARVAGRRKDLIADDGGVEVRIVPFSTLGGPRLERRIDDVPAEETDMHAMIERISDAARSSGWVRSAVPWPSSLPTDVSIVALQKAHDGDGVALGLTDLPELQRRGLSTVSERDEQIVFIGGVSAPIPETMATYAAAITADSGSDDLHVYGIDLVGRGLQQLELLPSCGSVAVRNDALALRILRWLSSEAAARRTMLAESGSSNIWEHQARGGEMPPRLVLFVSGAERLLSADSPHQQLIGPLGSLVNDAVGVRIQIILGGLPKIVHNKLGMNISRRFVMQLAEKNEYGPLGVSKTLGAALEVDRRCVDLPSGRLTQLGRLTAPGGIESDAFTAVASKLPAASVRPPKRFTDVTWPLPLVQVPLDEGVVPPGFVEPVGVGVDLGTGDWTYIDAIDDGPFLPISGPPKSGRSTALLMLAIAATHAGWNVVTLTHSRRSPLSTSNHHALGCRTDFAGLEATLDAQDGRTLVLIDDLHRVEDGDLVKPAVTAFDRVVLAVAAPTDLIAGRTGVMRSLPPISGGMLLSPQTALDGQAIGLRRLADEWMIDRRAGRGILALAGEARQIQVPLVEFG